MQKIRIGASSIFSFTKITRKNQKCEENEYVLEITIIAVRENNHD